MKTDTLLSIEIVNDKELTYNNGDLTYNIPINGNDFLSNLSNRYRLINKLRDTANAIEKESNLHWYKNTYAEHGLGHGCSWRGNGFSTNDLAKCCEWCWEWACHQCWQWRSNCGSCLKMLPMQKEVK